MAEDSPDLVKYYASKSFWLESCNDDLSPRPKLREELAVDIAILGWIHWFMDCLLFITTKSRFKHRDY